MGYVYVFTVCLRISGIYFVHSVHPMYCYAAPACVYCVVASEPACVCCSCIVFIAHLLFVSAASRSGVSSLFRATIHSAVYIYHTLLNVVRCAVPPACGSVFE